jgi:hypothetical protein
MLEKFKKNQISFDAMKSVKGGSVCSNCIASNGPACNAAGHATGSGGYDTCVITLRTACENQSFCQQ